LIEDFTNKMGYAMVCPFDQFFEPIDHNAGIPGFENGIFTHDPDNLSLGSWRAVHKTNLEGVFPGCKHGNKAMRKTRSVRPVWGLGIT
jgi:hypothetical protein